MKHAILKFGTLSGLILVALSAISYFTLGTDPNNYAISELVGYTSMVLALAVIFFALINYRKNHRHLSFGKGFVIGLGISSIAALFFSIFDVLYTTVINPNFTSDYVNYYVEQIQANTSLSAAEKSAQLAEMKYFADLGSAFMGFIMFVTVLLIGVFISLIAAAVLKKKDSTVDNS